LNGNYIKTRLVASTMQQPYCEKAVPLRVIFTKNSICSNKHNNGMNWKDSWNA